MSTFYHILATILTLISLIFIQPSFSQTTCKSKTFSNSTTTFSKCINLPTLNAILHYTYNPSKSTLSMAFTAAAPSAQGWVSWAINPKGLAMLGSQALIAHKPTNNGGSILVNTYDIQAYHPILNGPISYHVSNLAAEESNGEITIFATWTLPKGEVVEINQVWQVGPLVKGEVSKHAFEKSNLNSFMKLSLADGAVSTAPSVPPAAMASMAGGDGTAVSAAPSKPPAIAPTFVTGGEGVAASAPTPKNGVIKGQGISSILVLVLLILSFFSNYLV